MAAVQPIKPGVGLRKTSCANVLARAKEIERISSANTVLLRCLDSAKSRYDTRQWEIEFRQHRYLVSHLSKADIVQHGEQDPEVDALWQEFHRLRASLTAAAATSIDPHWPTPRQSGLPLLPLPHITVQHGDNEIWKQSLRDAIHALDKQSNATSGPELPQTGPTFSNRISSLRASHFPASAIRAAPPKGATSARLLPALGAQGVTSLEPALGPTSTVSPRDPHPPPRPSPRHLITQTASPVRAPMSTRDPSASPPQGATPRVWPLSSPHRTGPSASPPLGPARAPPTTSMASPRRTDPSASPLQCLRNIKPLVLDSPRSARIRLALFILCDDICLVGSDHLT
jgi:hypothetical protein